MYKNLFQKPNVNYLIFYLNFGIKIKMGYYLLDRRYGVPNTFSISNRTSKSKIFGLRLWFTLIN